MTTAVCHLSDTRVRVHKAGSTVCHNEVGVAFKMELRSKVNIEVRIL